MPGGVSNPTRKTDRRWMLRLPPRRMVTLSPSTLHTCRADSRLPSAQPGLLCGCDQLCEPSEIQKSNIRWKGIRDRDKPIPNEEGDGLGALFRPGLPNVWKEKP